MGDCQALLKKHKDEIEKIKAIRNVMQQLEDKKSELSGDEFNKVQDLWEDQEIEYLGNITDLLHDITIDFHHNGKSHKETQEVLDRFWELAFD